MKINQEQIKKASTEKLEKDLNTLDKKLVILNTGTSTSFCSFFGDNQCEFCYFNRYQKRITGCVTIYYRNVLGYGERKIIAVKKQLLLHLQKRIKTELEERNV